jgi:hypothetical protein
LGYEGIGPVFYGAKDEVVLPPLLELFGAYFTIFFGM